MKVENKEKLKFGHLAMTSMWDNYSLSFSASFFEATFFLGVKTN